MNDLTWTCHVCGDGRPDATISVHKIDRSKEHGLPPLHYVVNIRYCNDRAACREGAPTCELARSGATRSQARRVDP